jgi:hypothetical protein
MSTQSMREPFVTAITAAETEIVPIEHGKSEMRSVKNSTNRY